MSDITIVPLDDVWVRLDTSESLARELNEYFTFQSPGSQFMRRQSKFRGWDGRIRLFKLRTRTIYRGLVHRIYEFAEHHNYTVENLIDDTVPFLPDEALDEWLAHMKDMCYLPFPVRDYQKAALRAMLDQHRGIIVSPTGSGKSYVIWLLTQAISVPKTLIIVPTIGLVTQMTSDFVSYGCDAELIHIIRGGKEKHTDCPIVVSTWQSIYEQDDDYFKQFGMVVCDEVHLAQAKSLTGLMTKCITVPYRFGFTGTLSETQAHLLILEGLFGPVTKVTTTTALVKAEQLAPLHVKMIVLKYPEQTCKNNRHSQYQDEVDYIVGDPARTEFIARMVAQLKGNVLVLFTLIGKHGKALYERIKEHAPHKTVHFVTGSVGADQREDVRTTVENDNIQTTIHFGDRSATLSGDMLVRLSDGTQKTAGTITENDDVDAAWISLNTSSK